MSKDIKPCGDKECEYWRSRAAKGPGPTPKLCVPKSGTKRGTIQVLPLTGEEIEQLGRIATEQKVSFDTVVQKALREAIRRYEMKQTSAGKRTPSRKEINSSENKTLVKA